MSALTIMPEADAVKAKGTNNQKFGSATKNIVCGDKLCSDTKRDGEANQQSRFQVGGVAQQGQQIQISPELKAKLYPKPFQLKLPEVCSLTGATHSYSDIDNDGLADPLESAHGADPTKFDTDGDGLSDRDEICVGNKSKPNDVDSDDDGRNDAQDQCRMNAETVNDYYDLDGCPDSTPNTIITSAQALTSSTTAQFSFTTDSLTPASMTFHCMRDSGGWGSCTSPKSYSGLTPGTHTFQVRVIDPASDPDYYDPTPASHQWTIESIAPVITVNPLVTNDNTPLITGTIDDPAAIITVIVAGQTMTVQNAGSGTWAFTRQPALPDATYNINAKATDPVGNIGTDPTNNELKIDTTRPSVTITSSPTINTPTTNNLGPYTLTITFSEPVLNFDVSDLAFTAATIIPNTFGGSGASYTVQVMLEDGIWNSIALSQNKVQDVAGNYNTQSNGIYTTPQVAYPKTIPEINGTKFHDSNADHDILGESPLSGITIGLFEVGRLTPLATTVTDADGFYEFTNVQIQNLYHVIMVCEVLTYVPNEGESYPWPDTGQKPTGTSVISCYTGYPTSALYGYGITGSYTGPTTGLDFGNNRTAP